MPTVILIALMLVFPLSRLLAQLQFPVVKGYVDYRDTHCPVQGIVVEGNNDSIYACESGVIINIFDVEGKTYIQIKGKYFITYGPFATINVKRLDSLASGTFLGNVLFSKNGSKYLDVIIMEGAKKTLLLKDIFPAHVREKAINPIHR